MPQGPSSAPVLITLALATIGRTNEVVRLFDSLGQQKNSAFEVILADQNQDERLVSVVKSATDQGMNITHVRLDKPNQYAARTVGIKMARGEYIAFPDDDCWYEPNTIDEAIHAFETTGADGLIARWRDAAPLEEDLRHGLLRWEDARKFRTTGTSMIVQFYKTDVMNAIGGFDDRLGLGRWYGGCEDADILFTMLQKKMRVVHAPQVIVRHRFDMSLDRIDFKKSRSRARGTGALYAKHKLSFWVIFRGFFAPILKPKITRNFGVTFTDGCAQMIGRIEGYLKWRLEKK